MFERYKARIEKYCEREGIEIPVGFYRHDIGRYAAINLESDPPKLVATTWTNEADTIQYLLGPAAHQATRLLDFKEQCEVRFNGGNVLLRGDPF
jgi:hypothetical protein